jgi:hypothetical protein
MWVLHLAPLKQCALIIIMWVLHLAPLKQCALIIIMWELHLAPLKQCALIIIMWVLHFCTSQTMCINYHYVGIVKVCFSIWVHNAIYVLHFGFLFNDECL